MVLAERNLKVAEEVEEWPRAIRRASINSFGYGGANAHVILEAPESYLDQDYHSSGSLQSDDVDEQTLLVLPVSAASPKSLQTLVGQISIAVAQSHDMESLQSLAHTLAVGRDHLHHKTFLLAKLDKGREGPINTAADQKRAASPLPFGFVFTGQGAQYAGMAKELLFTSQNFRDTIRRLDSVLRSLPATHAPNWTLEQTLLDGANSLINKVTHSQPICTAVQIGLVNLLRSWGIQATFVVGHSSGEIAAAYTAGHLTFKQAILVAYFRGFAVSKLRIKGAMMAAGLNSETAKHLIKDKGLVPEVRVACINSPESVTLSGSVKGIEVLKQHMESENKFVRALETEGRAYHSYMMEEVGEMYEELLAPFFGDSHDLAEVDDDSFAPTRQAKLYSSVGHDSQGLGFVDGQTYMPAYWRKNLEQPVQFSAAVANLVAAADKKVHLIEIGPHAALKGPIKQIRSALKLSEESLQSETLIKLYQDG